MNKYKFVKKGFFESMDKFEGKVNDFARKGWRVITMTRDPNGQMVVLFERIDH